MSSQSEPLHFLDRNAWRAWLEKHHAREQQAWLAIRRKYARSPGLSLEPAVEEALCFGWIDGGLRTIDDETYALRFSPRRRGSVWSETNKRRATRLIAQGRMKPAGMLAIETAKRTGEWERASSREDITRTPPELARALQSRPEARAALQTMPASFKKQYFWWIASAKTDATRHRRVNETIRLILKRKRAGVG